MANPNQVLDSQSVMYQLLNIIIKQAFRETKLKQEELFGANLFTWRWPFKFNYGVWLDQQNNSV